MMQRGAVSQQIPDRPGRTGLLIEGTIDDSRNPGPDDSTCTHRTGLEGDDKGSVVEAPSSGRLGGIAQCHELGMSERILIDFASVVTAPDHRTISAQHHGPDGNVVMRTRQRRLGEGECHPILEVCVGAEAEIRTLPWGSLLR